ncbi:hypothetical protein ACWEPL_59570 [Nonomuraea sp. NPDC004186]
MSAQTRKEHRQVRRAAELRRAEAQRELHRFGRETRRAGKTSLILVRAGLAELSARSLTKLAARLRGPS